MPQRPVSTPVSPAKNPAPAPCRLALTRAVAAAALAALLSLPGVAQAAPAAASPICEVPALPKPAPSAQATPATPPLPSPSAAASPAAKATPVAATPVAAVEIAPDTLAAELDAVSRSLAACLTDGDGGGVAELVTEPWLSAWFGGAQISREQFLQIAPELTLPPMEIRSVSDVRRTGAKAAAAEVEYVIGRQLSTATWTFAEAPPAQRVPGTTAWRVDGEESLPASAPAGAPEIEAAFTDGGLTLSGREARAGDLRIAAANDGKQEHELIVLRFASGFTLPDLLRAAGPGLPAEAEWIGSASLPAGGDADLVLVDLQPGVYWVLCLLPDAEGMPHALPGESASFEVK